jgi:hypothetical protein
VTIEQHLTDFAGLSVLNFTDLDLATPDQPAGWQMSPPVAWRISARFEGETFGEVFERFLTDVDTSQVTALVLGHWEALIDEPDPVDLLAADATGKLDGLSFPPDRTVRADYGEGCRVPNIYDHRDEFAGLPVVQFHPVDEDDETDRETTEPLAADPVAWRVATEFDGMPFAEVFEQFLSRVDTSRLTALVIGYWDASYDTGAVDPVEVLAKAADRLPSLRALFLGDITPEEQEISWIEHSDITPLFTAFPHLERLEVRGGGGQGLHDDMLRMDAVQSDVLKVLRFESGGLPANVVRAVASSELPNLERLELWLGVRDYGGDATVADLAPILSGERLPALRHLGLRNSAFQDEIAAAVAGAPVVAGLESLDLSLGGLSDEGAEALLSGQPLTHLTWLDLHFHSLSDGMVDRMRAALPGDRVDLNDGDRPYVAVTE